MRKVILSKRASVKLDKLLDHLENDWSEKVKLDFINKLDQTLQTLKTFPESNEKSSLKKGLYRCVVSRQTTFFYQFNTTTIKIVTFFDTRMDPGKIRKFL